MYFSDCIVREEGAIMWQREAEYSLEFVWGAGKILTVQLWHQSKQSHNVQWQEQVVIVSYTEKYCGLQCDIVCNNRSFNTTSFLKPLPAQHSHFLRSSADQMHDDYSKTTITQEWSL